MFHFIEEDLIDCLVASCTGTQKIPFKTKHTSLIKERGKKTPKTVTLPGFYLMQQQNNLLYILYLIILFLFFLLNKFLLAVHILSSA